MVDLNYSTVAQETALSSGIDDSQTSYDVDGTAGFPAVPFHGILDPEGANEAVLVSAVVGTTLTVTRGINGTTAIGHGSGTKFRHMAIGRDLQLSRDHENADADVHGLTGGDTVLGRAQVATVEGKTIDGGQNTIQNVPQSAVVDLEADLDDAAQALADHAADAKAHTGFEFVVSETDPGNPATDRIWIQPVT